MTIRYVGPGGSDANNGLTWSTRKLTLNGAEDTPVTPGDVVFVGAGTYRETLTVDVSGTFGNTISYIGDYTGQNTDGVGGLVRVTGSNDDKTATRANCINASSSKGYREFKGFYIDTATGAGINNANGPNWTISDCYFAPCTGNVCISISGPSQACTIQRCFFTPHAAQNSIIITHSSVVDNSGHVIQNCILQSGSQGVRADRVGGVSIKNCVFSGIGGVAVRVQTALTVGQTVTVNNCIFQAVGTALQGTVVGEIVEDNNTFFGNTTVRTNTATGTNSVLYPALFDARWFFQATHAGAGPYNPTQVVTPYDLSSFSQLLNLPGTSPSATDLRGTAIQNTQREWGALEYDSTLSTKARQASSIDGGGMVA